MAALPLHHNALITQATKVYLGHSTCTKCREVINFASQLGKSAFQCWLLLLCARSCQWKLNTVMNFLVRIKLSILLHSLRMPSRLRREAESTVSCNETCCCSSETAVWRTGACIKLFEWQVEPGACFLARSEGCASPSAPRSPGTLKPVIHVWSVQISSCHHVLSPPYFLYRLSIAAKLRLNIWAWAHRSWQSWQEFFFFFSTLARHYS